MPSESIAELPEKKAAMSLVAAIARLPAMAAMIATLDSSVIGHTITNQALDKELVRRVSPYSEANVLPGPTAPDWLIVLY